MARSAEEARVKPTEEEERDWIEEQLTALEEGEGRFWDGEADVVDDGEDDDDDDEKILDVAEEEEEEVEAVTAEDKEAEAVAAEDDEEMVTGPAWDLEEKNLMRPMREESPVVPEV